MDLGLGGKVALVTAASRGLGLASARALSAEGASVLISSRDQAAVDAAAAGLPGTAAAVAADMNDPDSPRRLVDAAVERFGRLDVVVANNGGPPPGSALEVTDDGVRAAVEANLLSAVRLVRASAPHLRAAGGGRICCITSFGVVRPIPTLPLSNIARTGLYAWVKTAARELFDDRITINVICPGPHSTDRMKQLGGTGPMGDPDDFGRVVAFLCSASTGFLTGSAVVVDGGATGAL